MITVTDSATGRKTTYYYDFTDRLMKYTESGSDISHSVSYTYDDLNNLTKMVEVINGTTRNKTYTYDDDNRVQTVSYAQASKTYTYDGFGRVSKRVSKHGSTTVATDTITYRTVNGNATGQVSSLATAAGTYTYTYDGNGNIKTVGFGGNTTAYTYDKANQLLREDNQAGGFTYVWEYDDAGNITSRTEYAYTTADDPGTALDTVTYSYGDSNWGDLLTAYDGVSITHDKIGNPLNDGTWTYTWEHGRELAAMSDGTTTWTYTYDANGMRTKRTDGSTTYSYVYNGSQLTQLTVNGVKLTFTYGTDGAPTSVTYDSTRYFYAKNLQGDVMALVSVDGDVVVEYTYDAWGNILATAGSLASTLGVHNPLRYRGYVYDTETELYYLQSRYYDPQVGRFINADAYTSTGQGLLGNNMFTYCGNNPVNRSDPSGHLWRIVLITAICAIALSGCGTSGPGAAPDYVEIGESDGTRSKNPNCYAYAIGYYDQSYDPGDFSTPFQGFDVESVADAVIWDMEALGRGVRVIDGYDAPINDNEYRIALRVSQPKLIQTQQGIMLDWDYHFMVQTSDGNWAEKHGPGGATVYHPTGTPDTISWDLGTTRGYYTSEIVYFAVTEGQ